MSEKNDVLTDAEWLRTVAEDVSRYEEDAQRLRRIANSLEAQSTERELVEALRPFAKRIVTEKRMQVYICPMCEQTFNSISPPNFCPYGCGELSCEAGYVTAFYDLADMMGITAQPRSPKDVWEQQMRPRLVAMLSKERGRQP